MDRRRKDSSHYSASYEISDFDDNGKNRNQVTRMKRNTIMSVIGLFLTLVLAVFVSSSWRHRIHTRRQRVRMTDLGRVDALHYLKQLPTNTTFSSQHWMARVEKAKQAILSSNLGKRQVNLSTRSTPDGALKETEKQRIRDLHHNSASHSQLGFPNSFLRISNKKLVQKRGFI
eukprot:scaffold151739_cov54-Attheya_sp.AAC.4